MLGLNTITLISSRVGSFIKRIITDGLKMRLPFTSAKPLGEELVVNGDFSNYEDSPYPAISGVVFANWDKDQVLGTSEYTLESIEGGYRQTITSAATSPYAYRTRLTQDISHKLKIGRRYTFSCKFRSSEPVSVSRLIAKKNSADPQLSSNTETTQSNQQYTTLTETFVCDANTEQNIMFWMNTYSTDIWLEVVDVSLKEHDQVAEDTSNNENNAILKTGKCLEFSTGNDHINIDGFSVDTNEATFAFWAKPASNTSGNSDMIIDLGSGDRFFISVAENRWKIYQYVSGGSDFVLHDPNWKVITNYWQRVVISIDKNNYASVYRNGTLLTEPRLLPTPLNLSGKSNGAIGCSYNKVDNFYVGYLSDIQVYDKAWSSDDVTYDYANPQNLVTDNSSTDIHLRNLKAWWHLSEGSGAIAHDSAPLIGGEEVVNGDFSTDSDFGTYLELSDWNIYDNENTSSSGWGISGGALNYDGSGSQYNKVFQVLNTLVGKTYKMTFTLSGLSSSGVNFGFGSSSGSFVNPQQTYSANGTYTRYMVADRTDHSISIQNNSATQTFSIDNISVKEVYNRNADSYIDPDNNVATPVILGGNWEDGQETIPQLGLMDWSKGSNLIDWSEDLHHWNAINGAVKSFDSDIVNPQGTIGSWKVAFDGTTNGRVERGIAGTTGLLTYSVWLKVDSGTATAQIGASTNGALVVTVTDEWQRFTHTQIYTSSTTYPRLRCDESGAEIYMWGAQHEYGSKASAYRKTKGLAATNSTLIKTPDVEQFTGNKVTRNLIHYSEDLGSYAQLGGDGWGMHDCTVEYGYEDPFGSNRASKIISANLYGPFDGDPWVTSGVHYNTSSNREYTSSMWVKGTSSTVGDTARLWVVRNGTEFKGEDFTITEDWQRISTTQTFTQSPEGQQVYFRIDTPELSTLGDEVFVFGAQLQEGGLTRYFPTYGAIAQETLPIIGKDVLGNDVESRNSSLNLDGIGYAEVLDDNIFDIGINEAFSICGWARWKYVPQGVPGVFVSSLNTIYSNGITLGNSNTFSVSVKNVAGNNKVSAFINTSEILSSTTYNEGDWFYFALTRREGGGNDTGKLYLSKIEQGDWVVVQDGNIISNNSAITNSNNKTIGWDTLGGDRKYHDLIDDIKFYDRELSLTEIQQNFNATKSAHTN